MKRVLFVCALACMLFACSVASADTVPIEDKLRSYSETGITSASHKNDGEDRFYITLTDGTFRDGKNNSVFGGRARLNNSEGTAVSHYETMDNLGKYNFPYIQNMNAKQGVKFKYKIDSTSKTPYMNVWGRFTA
ncbi:MAG: hypothetical protein Q4G52_04385 [Clostridia bacterium]|nr:hypothetical protein [Clostridia bacterium]